MTVDESEVMRALSQVNDPELRRSIVDLGMVRDLVVEDGRVAFTLALTIPECPLRDQLVREARMAVEALPGVNEVLITTEAMSEAERAAAFGHNEPPWLAASHNRVRNVIAVMSGKGGVGKSLVTGLLAAALSRADYRVGVLDADMTGPSIPRLFGIHGPPQGGPQGIEPIRSQTGIKIMSINLLIEDEGQAVIWRGPLISGAIQQFWSDVHWGELDYLLVDLPPGTSDAALTVMQSLPVTGILMVTTPQSLSSMVVRKAVQMAQTVGVPILGIVENMSGFVAPDTGNHYDIFGPSHATEVAAAAGAPLLARLPIDPAVTLLCDKGEIEMIHSQEIEPLVVYLEGRLPVSKTAFPHLEGA